MSAQLPAVLAYDHGTKLTVKDVDEFLKYCGLPHLRDILSKDGISEVTDMTHADLTQLSTPISPLELNQLQTTQRQLQLVRSTQIKQSEPERFLECTCLSPVSGCINYFIFYALAF